VLATEPVASALGVRLGYLLTLLYLRDVEHLIGLIFMARSKPPSDIRKRREKPTKPVALGAQRYVFGKTVLGGLLGALGLLGTLVGIAGAFPRLSVNTQGSVRTHDPFGTVFYLSNDGVLPLHDITYGCRVDELVAKGMNLQNMLAFDSRRSDPVLSPDRPMTLDCHQYIELDGSLPSLHATITVHYRPSFIPWWYRVTNFRMQAIKSDDGTWIWSRIAD
jgi:hypothetical protein